MKKTLLWILGLVVLMVIVLGIFYGPVIRGFLKTSVVEVDPQLTLFLGGGGNTLVLKSEDHRTVLIVDTKMGSGAKAIRQYVDRLGKDVKIYVVNTHDHPDHVGGNSLFEPAILITGDYSFDQWKKETGYRSPDEKVAVGSQKELTIGSEVVSIYNLGQAHTTNDTVVYLKNRKLLHTGDLFFNQMHPVLQISHAHVGKWIRALDFLISHFEIKTVVPGHGPVTDQSGLQSMRDYFTSIAAAKGDPAQLAVLRKRYASYLALPGMSGFDKTVAYIAAEKKAEGK